MKQIIVIGGSNRDISARAQDEIHNISDSHRGVLFESHGGVGRNIAEVLGRLGAPVTLLSSFGDDAFSQEMRDVLIGLNVDLSPSLVTASMRADSYLAVLDYRGEMVTSINQMKLISLITAKVIQDRADLICQADIVVCDCNVPSDIMAAIAHLPRQGIFIVDGVSGAKVLRIQDILNHIDVVKLAYKEAVSLTGSSEVTPPASLIRKLSEMGLKQTLLSLGGDGFMINEKDKIHHFTALEEAPMATSGAGDCLLAGYVYGLARDLPITMASQYGRMSAYLSCKSLSAVNYDITCENIERLIAEDTTI